jgi:hypothetical protein
MLNNIGQVSIFSLVFPVQETKTALFLAGLSMLMYSSYEVYPLRTLPSYPWPVNISKDIKFLILVSCLTSTKALKQLNHPPLLCRPFDFICLLLLFTFGSIWL